MKNYGYSFLWLLFTGCMYHAAFAQDDAVMIGGSVRLYSEVMREERPLLISLPPGYSESSRTYPVMFLFDGDEGTFIRHVGIVRYLSLHHVPLIPGMIVVGIPNTNRGRDLSVTPLEQLPSSGQADTFIRFLTEELIPFVDEEYRTTGYRLLAGGSAAGEVAIHTLLTKPDAFDAILAGGPALGFSGEPSMDRAREFFENGHGVGQSLFVGHYERDFTVVTEWIPKLIGLIEKVAPPGFRWSVRTYPGKAHVPTTYVEDGLRWVFRDWSRVYPPTMTPAAGTIPEGESVEVRIDCNAEEIRYTLDGEEPTHESMLYAGPIRIEGSTIVKAKGYDGALSESGVRVAEYSAGSLQPASRGSSVMEQGLEYAYFERLWYLLPDHLDMEPIKTGICERVDLGHRKKDQGYLFRFQGFIDVPKDGVYTFFLESGSDAKLFIDGTRIIENRGSRPNQDPRTEIEEGSATIGLETGYHSIRLLYANAWFHTTDLALRWQGPGMEKQAMESGTFYHMRVSD